MDQIDTRGRGVRRTGRHLMAFGGVLAMLVAGAVGLATVSSDVRATAQTGTGGAQYFLQIDGIPGESLDAAHKDQIELLSYEWSGDGKPGLEQPGDRSGATGTGVGSGRPQLNAIRFTQNVSKASPLLVTAAATAKHINQATLSVRRSGATPVQYLTIKLTDVVVTSYRTAATGGAAPTDEFTLTFARLDYSYAAQRPDGSLAPPIVSTWDFTTGTGG